MTPEGTGALEDADLPGWLAERGLPGLYDVHVHFLPKNVMDRVWAQFDDAGPLIGRPWPITYRGTDHERVQTLRGLGVRRFSALPYAHRPGIAGYLNDWARGFAEVTPEALHCATFYPEPSAVGYVDAGIREGVELFKVHIQVGDFDPRDPLLDEVWGRLEDAGVPVVVHAGSGPVPTTFTGPEPFAEVLRAHPRLTAIIAHLGAPDYREFLALAERFERVHLDTTMAFTDFFEAEAPFPADLRPRLGDLGHRVLFGSDFPNIPYPYAHQVQAVERLGLGEDWLRRVCWENAVALLG